jgi:hypothetical protein
MEEYKKHIKIYNEIKTLGPKMSWYYKLNEHEKNEAINNTLLQLLAKEKEGVIQLIDLQVYKGYMFITLKNAIGRILNTRKTIANQARITAIDINDIQIGYQAGFDVDEKFDLKIISNINKAIFRWHIRGWDITYISKAIGMPPSTVARRLHKVEEYLVKGGKISKLRKKWLAK